MDNVTETPPEETGISPAGAYISSKDNPAARFFFILAGIGLAAHLLFGAFQVLFLEKLVKFFAERINADMWFYSWLSAGMQLLAVLPTVIYVIISLRKMRISGNVKTRKMLDICGFIILLAAAISVVSVLPILSFLLTGGMIGIKIYNFIGAFCCPLIAGILLDNRALKRFGIIFSGAALLLCSLYGVIYYTRLYSGMLFEENRALYMALILYLPAAIQMLIPAAGYTVTGWLIRKQK
ncbi:MAG: hypothetical protein FWE80_10155 [Oscillospiraceae bacterium]|nr:hypothetical protein [Oscillospiraceae bacterium]